MAETLPSNVSTFTVVGRLVQSIADSADADTDVDVTAMTGVKVTFTPSLDPPIFKVTSATPPITVYQSSIEATTDSSGYLKLAADTARGVELVYGFDPDVLPNGWTWNVRISVGGNFPDQVFSIQGSPGGVIDLSTVIPVPPNPGNAEDIAFWTSAVEQTDQARDEAVAAAESVADVVATNDGIMTAVLQDEDSSFTTELTDTIADLHVVTVTGGTLTVKAGHTYEVTATGTVSLSGPLGAQAALVIMSAAATTTIAGQSVVTGQTWVAVRLTAGWVMYAVGDGDFVAPTVGTLTSSLITQTGFTLTVTGAADETELSTTPFRFSTNGGSTWSAWQASATFAFTGGTAATVYQCRHETRDDAGNVSTGVVVPVTTAAVTYTNVLLHDTFTRAEGSTVSAGPMDSGQTWTGSTANSKIYSNMLSPFTGTILATHGGSGAIEGQATFVAPASTDCGFSVAFKSVAGVFGDGWGIKVTRQATRDIMEFEGTGVTCTFNNGNGSLVSAPWAFLPGHAYATAQTYVFRCVIAGTLITIYCNGTRILEGTFAGSSATIIYIKGLTLKSFGYVDDVKVLS